MQDVLMATSSTASRSFRHVLDRIDPNELSGTVLAVPAVNVFGLIQESRYLPDRRDLNRCFPGSKRGSSAAQLAHLFMTEIVSRCEMGIDLHTGSGGRTNLPQLRCDLDQLATLRLAREFGAPLLLHSRCVMVLSGRQRSTWARPSWSTRPAKRVGSTWKRSKLASRECCV